MALFATPNEPSAFEVIGGFNTALRAGIPVLVCFAGFHLLTVYSEPAAGM